MAALPPRQKNNSSRQSKQEKTDLQVLIQMGVPKTRAEKALASTGHRGVQLASDWLLAHVNDPFLDDNNPREYILYVCPTGPLLKELESFWLESKNSCGWNGAHNFLPHITLVSFFKAPDESAITLSETLKQVVENIELLKDKSINLDEYTSQNFMGFFVTEEDANYLKRIAIAFVKEVSHSIIGDTYEHLNALVTCFPWCAVSSARCIPKNSRSISLEPHVKSLHLTLAYQFSGNHYSTLKTLVESVNPTNPANWELRLYSRDSRLSSRQVYRVLHSHRSRDPDELDLRIGDFIYINTDAFKNSTDGWIEGVSWLTGVSGFLPENYVERTAESDAWTLHCAHVLNQPNVSDIVSEVDDVDGIDSASTIEVQSIQDQDVTDIVDMIDNNSSNTEIGSGLVDPLFDYPKPIENDQISKNNTSNLGAKKKASTSSRSIYIMRHGERVDFTFGEYIPFCFDKFGNYSQKDLNMPETFPHRKTGIKCWSNDSPLTNIGLCQANLTGKGLHKSDVQLTTVLCSPSYRCVQTCDAILNGLGVNGEIQICIEPGLFEWLAWYQDGIPQFYTPQELKDLGFNVNTEYEPIISIDQLKQFMDENMSELYKRNSSVTEFVIKDPFMGNVLIVGHAITLDTCTRSVIGKEERLPADVNKLMYKIPYCSLVKIQEIDNDSWALVDVPLSQITHTNNQRFDWNYLNVS